MAEPIKPDKAIIYCRVSSTKQKIDGNGLSSQETRCREYASYKGYQVVAVFQDDASGGLVERKGMMSMLTYLKKEAKETHAVIIDDISRLARGLKAHIKLRASIAEVGGMLVSPSIEFGDDPDSMLVEHMLASVSEHHRGKNAEQTRNRMRARVMAGYAVTRAPYGYRYEKKVGHGKLLVRNEPLASIIQEGLEGYATGRFQTQVEVGRFFGSKAVFPRNQHGEVGGQSVNDILTRPIYAGYVQAPHWNISMRKGHHEGLITLETFEKIQHRLNDKPKVPTNRKTHLDFPLRGFVACGDCEKPMTAAWSKGKNKHHPYYRCVQRGCVSCGKSVNANKMHEEFKLLLETLEPSRQLFTLAAAIFKDIWDSRLKSSKADKASIKTELTKLDKKIVALLDRIVEATSDTIIGAYEKRLKELETEKLILTENLHKTAKPSKDFLNTFHNAMNFLSNPQILWASECIEDKRAVLKLAFMDNLPYIRNRGFGTPKLSLPFKALKGKCEGNFRMVPLG